MRIPDFPVIPQPLKALSPTEEKMVSLAIPFLHMEATAYDKERRQTLRGDVYAFQNEFI